MQNTALASESPLLWQHGTEVHFDCWQLPIPKPKHKGGLSAHSAIFFTTSRKFALGAAEGTGGLVTTTINANAKVIDLDNCTDAESDAFRKELLTCSTASNNMQYQTFEHWREACKSGAVMKLAPMPELQLQFRSLYDMAMNHPHSFEGQLARDKLQLLTRQNIEDIVLTAIELGYDCVITNEIDTLDPTGIKTYPVMFAVNTDAITPPVWIAEPVTLTPPISITSSSTVKPSTKKKTISKKKQQKADKKKHRKSNK